MTRKRRRLWLVAACLCGLGSATALSLAAFRRDLVFFVTPSDMAAHARPGHMLRLGGLVEAGSLQRDHEGATPVARFRVTDTQRDVAVTFAGILPDLFREGQGVVALGTLEPDGTFRASEVLAKHDANYMPKDVADALRARGEWRPETGAPPPAGSWNVQMPDKTPDKPPGRPPG